MSVRAMTEADIDAAYALTAAALAPFEGGSTPSQALTQAARARSKLEHCLATDAGGCFVAERDGERVGVAVAIVREGLWGLSQLAVRPDLHARGLGGELLDAALAYGAEAGAAGGLIVSSPDPKALRLYARAGFDCRPTVDCGGIVDRSGLPAGAGASVQASTDVDRTERVSRFVRGASHAPDLEAMLSAGMRLLIHDGDRGFCVHDGDSVRMVAAVDEQAAQALLWAALAESDLGATVEALFISAGQDWAVRVVLEAGLALTPNGAIFSRGDVGSMRPYLPSGAYL